jgi:hypothetical protein
LFARLRARRASHGCCGAPCCGYDACCGAPCCGPAPCHGCAGYDCGGCGGYVVPMDGGAPVEDAAPPAAPGAEGGDVPSPPPAAALDRAPVAYRQVSFRR